MKARNSIAADAWRALTVEAPWCAVDKFLKKQEGEEAVRLLKKQEAEEEEQRQRVWQKASYQPAASSRPAVELAKGVGEIH